MAFLDSSTAVIDAILTRKGRELLARNDGSFQITKFAFGDDEINYQLYDATKATDQDADILNLPVLEPISNENVALLYRLITLPSGTLKIANLQISNSVFLAPMAGITDNPFRVICREMGAGVVYTEFVSANGIIRENMKTMELMKFLLEQEILILILMGRELKY